MAAFSALLALNYGWSSFTAARGGDIAPLLAALPPADLPLTVSAAGELAAYGSDRHNEFALDQLLGGLAATRRG